MGDPFRLLPFRYIGHSHAIGEALTYAFSEDAVDVCASLASYYALGHALYMGIRSERGKVTLSTVFDCMIFDGLASVLLPSMQTYHVCKITAIVLRSVKGVPLVVQEWGPLIMGLGLLFFSWETIDEYVNTVLDDTIRKLY